MDQQNKPQYQKWIDKALEDELAGKEILNSGHLFAPACFHFQQMTEKLLKALLVFNNKEFLKTHDLIALASLIESIVPDIANYKTELKILGRYYIETRYPGDFPEFTQQETQEAYESANRIKEFILEKVKNNN